MRHIEKGKSLCCNPVELGSTSQSIQDWTSTRLSDTQCSVPELNTHVMVCADIRTL